MANKRLRLSLFLLTVLAILVAGPGSPFCTAARAAIPQEMAMAGCDKPGPTQKHDAAAHPDCATPCIATPCLAPELATPQFGEHLITSERPQYLEGLHPGPEPDPPRSNRT